MNNISKLLIRPKFTANDVLYGHLDVIEEYLGCVWNTETQLFLTRSAETNQNLMRPLAWRLESFQIRQWRCETKFVKTCQKCQSMKLKWSCLGCKLFQCHMAADTMIERFIGTTRHCRDDQKYRDRGNYYHGGKFRKYERPENQSYPFMLESWHEIK